MAKTFFLEDIKNIEEFIQVSVDALNDIYSVIKNGYPYDTKIASQIPYKKREFLEMGKGMAGFKNPTWQLFIINISQLSQKSVLSGYFETKSLHLQAEILKPTDYKRNLNIMQFYGRKLNKGNFLALFMKDDENVPTLLVVAMPIKNNNINLNEIENKIKVL